MAAKLPGQKSPVGHELSPATDRFLAYRLVMGARQIAVACWLTTHLPTCQPKRRATAICPQAKWR